MAQGAIKAVIATQFDDTGLKKAQKQFGGLGKSLKSALGGAAIAAAAAGAVKVLADAGKAANDDAKSQILLAQQIKNTTNATDGQIAAVETAIGQMSLMSAVTDDQLRPAMASLVRATGDVSSAQDLLSLSLDVSAATGKDLNSVSLAIGKAYSGQTTALFRMIPGLKGSSDFMGKLREETKGMAAAAGNADPFMRLNIIFDELKESLGRAVLPLVAAFADLMAKNAPAVDAFFGKLAEVFQQLMPVVGPLFDIVSKLASMIGDALLAVMPTLIKVFEALLPVIDPVLSVLKTLVDAILPPLVQLIEQVLVPVLELLVGYINQYMLPYINDLAKALGDVLVQAVGVVIELFNQLKITFEPIIAAFNDLQKSTGIDFMAIFKSLNPALIALNGLAKGLAVVIFTMKMARAVMTGDWGTVAKLTKEGPFAAMEASAKAAAAAAGTAAAANREAGMAANFTTGTGAKSGGTGAVALTPSTKGGTVAKAKEDKAAKARAAALAAEKKKAEEAKQAYDELKAAIDNFNTSFSETADTFKAVFMQSAMLGDFEAQTIEAFDAIKQSAKDAFDSKLITKDSLTALQAYADREKGLLVGIAKQRDVLAKKISIAQSVTSGVMGSLDLNSMLQSETKTVTKSVTSIVNGIALTTTQSFDEVVTGGLAASFKKLVDKTKSFAGNLVKLKQLGLNGSLFKQIVEGGAEAGGATAEAIIAGGADAVKELNGLFGELEQAGSEIASTSTPVLYALGEDITNSFIDGLRSQDQSLIDTANSMAALFTTQFKNNLNLAIAPTIATAQSTAMSAQKAVDLSGRPDPKRSPQAYQAWLSGIGGIDPVRSPESYAKAQAASNTYNVTINANAITDKQSLPAMVTDALVTATKQGLTGGLSRLLAV